MNGFGNGNLWCMVVSHVAEDLRNAATKKFWSTILRNDAVDPNVFNDFIRHEEWWTYDLFAPAAALRLDVPDFCTLYWLSLVGDPATVSLAKRRAQPRNLILLKNG